MHRVESSALPPDPVSDAALADCASEPIRIPGAIQPHGYLIAFDNLSHVVRYASANFFALTARASGAILGRPLTEWLAPNEMIELQRRLDVKEPVDADAPLHFVIKGASFEAKLHRGEDLSILEFESSVSAPVNSEPVLARALRRLQGAVGLQTLHEVTVREVRALSGCDRVVIYAFGAQGHGRVLAEAKADDVASFLGLRFPASDIPTQARELYKLNWLRLIPDVHYEPVPVVAEQSSTLAAPLDMTFSSLRSVSPVHREYMRHMGVRSSLSISLLRDGELWGLISCGHRAPKLISAEIRTACLSIGRLLSLQISALESAHESKLIAANELLLAPIVEHMHRSSAEVFDTLAGAPQNLLALTGASGVAVMAGTTVTLMGTCPSQHQVTMLANWAAVQSSASGHFSSSTLALQYPPAEEFAQIASGLLTILLPKPVFSMVLWFRPEVTQTVTWAGDPKKAATLIPGTASYRLSPRHSFETWSTLSHHHAVAWGLHQIQGARDLRRILIEFDLADQVVRAQQAVAARDELVAIVSHDLRSPLSVVALQASMLKRTLATETVAPPRRVVVAAQLIERAATRMNAMLRDLLDLSTIEQGRYRVRLEPHRVEEIFEDSSALLSPVAESKSIALTFSGAAQLVVSADPERLYQVISNLVGNALKFTPAGGAVSVSARMDPSSSGEFIQFLVVDTGSGMAPERLTRIFDRQWQASDASPTGWGLGLYIARGIVAAHGGAIWATSTIGLGSEFFFTLRRAELATLQGNDAGE